ncbi:MAG TPA: GTPase HflX [Spirochaetota bacterium]|nr:GTPase HflX [Spirochaetota bacterium]
MTRDQVEKRIRESEGLIKTYGGCVVKTVIQRRHHAGSCSYVSLGKLTEILDNAVRYNINLIMINAALKPAQIYAIEENIEANQQQIEIWDRVDLILKIFQKHARTAEAKLQVKLARLNHLGPRIYNMSEELGREGGTSGAAANKGQGETNTEIMKRHIAVNRKNIKSKIKKLQYSRELNRKRRQKNGLKTVSIIGYTNAGKSALFRSLSGKKVYVKNNLFATLDTVTSRLYLPKSGKEVLLTDTIGFIRNLPPKLIDAFKSTLEETVYADLHLHVIDTFDEKAAGMIRIVKQVLADLKADNIPSFFVFNKIDLCDTSIYDLYKNYNGIFISAKYKTNLDLLKERISDFLYPGRICDLYKHTHPKLTAVPSSS